MKAAIIIPSRYSSTRLPGKALANIEGKPLVQWVYEACKKVEGASEVIIATDSEKIFSVGKGFGADVRMTATTHESGTDRCAEIAERLESDYIINVQGDEPFIDPKQLDFMIDHLILNPEIQILTLFHQMHNAEEIADASKVKLTKTKDNQILYFSRSSIPFDRNNVHPSYFRHVGIYAFQRRSLLEISKLKPSVLELAESLEQLRWLENGYAIHGLEIENGTLGVDTPMDLEKARIFARNHY